MVDADGSGEIDFDELVIALTQYAEDEGYDVTDADREFVHKAYDGSDHNADGKLNF